MLKLKKLLIPVDLSSPVGIHYGVQIAMAFHSHIHFVHVRPKYARIFPFAVPGGVAAAGSDVLNDNEHSLMHQRMMQYLQQFPLEGIQYTLTILYGVPTREILNLINDTEPDLVILGTQGMMKFEDIIIGSFKKKTNSSNNGCIHLGKVCFCAKH